MYSTPLDTALSVPTVGILANDATIEPLTASLVSNVSHGTLALNTDGSFVYTPATGYTGTDTFTYNASNGTETSNAATVTITIAPASCAGDGDKDDLKHPNGDDCGPSKPVKVKDDKYETPLNTPLPVAAPGVLANDPQHGTLTAVLASSVSHGTLALNPDGSFLYTPATGYTGADTFTYKAQVPGGAFSNIATVTITVKGPSCAGDDERAGRKDGQKDGRKDGPGRGRAGGPADRRGGPHGRDDENGCAPGSPAAANDSYSTDQGTTLTVSAPGVMTNDSDPQHLAITAALVSSVSHGTLTLAADGSFVYKPTSSFTGTDSFTYKVSNGSATSDPATVTITVTAAPCVGDGDKDDRTHPNDDDCRSSNPTAKDDAYSTTKNTSLTINSPGVLANDSDPRHKALRAVLTSTVSHGTLTLNSNGSFVYAPAVNYTGTDSFTYKASNGTQTSNTATVTIAVTADGRRMTGGGTFDGKLQLTHGFELHCDASDGPNNLEVNWKGHKFHLTAVTAASCSTDPSIKAGHPDASFNTYTGTGVGLYDNSTVVTATWEFTDAGEPGTKDQATLILTDAKGKTICNASGTVSKGNQQAHDQ